MDCLTIIPHYTYGNYCINWNIDSNKNAYGCNIVKCFEDDECNQTFAFPESVIQYTTIVHLDIQTLTFTTSIAFSNSIESKKLTKSSIFSLINLKE